MNSKTETGCCPRFDPAPWNGKEIKWKDKLFLKDEVLSPFHIPLNFGSVMAKNMASIEKAGALTPQPLTLSDDKSLWKTNLRIAISKEVPGATMEKISGTFLTKAFEGPYKNTGKWIKEMDAYVKSKNKETKKLYFYYTTCPKCAKAYGKNYTVLLAKVD